jgi:hypothetical protein
MVERLKRWESPRKRGRNDKGKGGSARARQLRKREQMLRQKLKNNTDNQSKHNQEREMIPSFFLPNLVSCQAFNLLTSIQQRLGNRIHIITMHNSLYEVG